MTGTWRLSDSAFKRSDKPYPAMFRNSYMQIQAVLNEYSFNISVHTLLKYMQKRKKKILKILALSKLTLQSDNKESNSSFVIFEDREEI